MNIKTDNRMRESKLENIKKAKTNNGLEGLTVTPEMVELLKQAIEDPNIKKEDLVKHLLKKSLK